jgi:FAD synthetase
MKNKTERGPVRVFLGGTFDGLHLGHVFLLQFARRRGLALARRQRRSGVHVSVVVARDDSVRRIKRTPAQHSEGERRKLVASLRDVDVAFLGVPNDFVRSVRRVDPDLVVLGYDQRGDWERILRDAGIEAKVIRCPPFAPNRLKSSVLRAELEKVAT